MKSKTALIILLSVISFNIRGQEKTDNRPFFEKFVVGTTLLSDVDQSRIQTFTFSEEEDEEDEEDVKKEETINVCDTYNYVATPQDCISLGFIPEWVSLFFYKNKDEQSVLGGIFLGNSRTCVISKNGVIDSRMRKHKLAVSKQECNLLFDAVSKSKNNTRITNIANEGQEFRAWQTEDYYAYIDFYYTDISLSDIYRQYKANEETTITVMYMMVSGKEFLEKTASTKKDGKNSDDLAQLLDSDEDIGNDEVFVVDETALKTIVDKGIKAMPLTDAPNLVPDGLRVADVETLEKYSWRPIAISLEDYNLPVFFNFEFAKDGSRKGEMIGHTEDNENLVEIPFDIVSSPKSPRQDIRSHYIPNEVREGKAYADVDRQRPLIAKKVATTMGLGSMSLFFDEDDDLLILNLNHELSTIVLHPTEKRQKN